MTAPRLVPAGVTLRAQVNTRWPNRDKASDGWIGDAAHAARVSDHNPDSQGWVHAIDIDKDGIDAEALADQLIAYARSKAPGSARLKNIVYRGRVASGTYADKFWVWRNDSSLGHYDHIHVSFTASAEYNGDRFPLPCFRDPAVHVPPAPRPVPVVVAPFRGPYTAPTHGPVIRTARRALGLPDGDLWDAAFTKAYGGYLLRHPYLIAAGARSTRLTERAYASLVKQL